MNCLYNTKKDYLNDLNLMNDLSESMKHCFEAIHLNKMYEPTDSLK